MPKQLTLPFSDPHLQVASRLYNPNTKIMWVTHSKNVITTKTAEITHHKTTNIIE